MEKPPLLVIGLFILIAAVACQATDIPGQATFKSRQAIVSVDIHSSIYRYKVMNLDTDRIVGFEIAQHAAYNFIAPDGWEKETPPGIFKAYTKEPRHGIEANKTAEFSLRVSSRGAILGSKPAKITFESGKTIIIPQVWAPVPEPKSYIILVAGMILAIIVMHTIITTKKRTQQNQTY